MKKFVFLGLALAGLFVFLGISFFGPKGIQEIRFDYTAENGKTGETEVRESIIPRIKQESVGVKEESEEDFAEKSQVAKVEKDEPKSSTKLPENAVEKYQLLHEEYFDELAGEIILSSKMDDDSGRVVFSYDQPEIPNEYHVSLTMEIFDENEALEDIYFSDEGWVFDPQAYNPHAGRYDHEFDVSSLEGKAYTLTVRISDATLSKEVKFYKMIKDYDGKITYKNF